MTEWLLRDGTPLEKMTDGYKYKVRGHFRQIDENRAIVSATKSCSRCGGAGASDKWLHTGRTCYDCQGTGLGRNVEVKLYAPMKLAHLNALRDKRRDKAELVRRSKEEAERREREENATVAKVKNAVKYPEAVAILKDYQGDNTFLLDLQAKYHEGYDLTENQATAIIEAGKRAEARRQWDARVEEILGRGGHPEAGRQDVTGLVLTGKWSESAYGSTLKLLVLDFRGFKIWCSAPRGFSSQLDRDDEGYIIPGSARGLEIEMKVTLQPKDPGFAFGSRPVLKK